MSIKKNLPLYLNAAVLWDLKKPLKIINNIKIPKLMSGQVLVKINYAGICHSQLMEQRGKRGKDLYLPHMLGHEGSGQVVKVAKNITKVKESDKVIISWIKGKGKNSKGAIYRYKNKIINSGPATTFSNYSIISENRLTKIPKGVSMRNATLFGCALPTGMGLVFNQIKPKKNNSIAIIGLGGVGMSAFLACNILKIKNVVLIDSSEQKINLLNKFGKYKTILVKNNSFFEEALKNNNGELFDICIESAGLTSTIEIAFKLTKYKNGKTFFASHPNFGEKISLDPFDFIRGKKLNGTWGGEVFPDRDFPLIAKKIIKDKTKLSLLLTKEYKLNEVNLALKDLLDKKVFRPIIKM